MKRLAIETATAACSVALFDGDKLVAHAHEVVGRGHAERLLPMIAALPGGGRAEAILVDCGPGSFTGIRVGIAAARALGFAWGASVSGYSALALIARDAPRPCVATMPGGHGELFARAFDRDGAMGPAASFPPDELAAFAEGRTVVHGGDPLDAREAMRRALACTGLPPVPIYGRAPDARPRA